MEFKYYFISMKTAKGQIAIAYSSIVQELSGIISLKEELYKADYHAYLERKYGNKNYKTSENNFRSIVSGK